MNNKQTVVKQLRKLNDTSLFKDCKHMVGLYLRMARKERNMTQSEVSNGRISTSQECKIEANKIIPDNATLDFLFEQTKFDRAKIDIIENSEDIMNRAFNFYYFNNVDEYKKIYDEYGKIKGNEFSYCIALGYFILTKDISSMEILINKISKLTTSFCESSLYLYSYYSAEYYYLSRKYQDCYEILQELSSRVKDKTLLVLIKDLSYRLAVDTERFGEAYKLKDELIKIYTLNNEFDKVQSINKYYLELLFTENDYRYLIDETKNIQIDKNSDFYDYYCYMLGISYLRIDNLGLAREYFGRINKESKYHSISVYERKECTLMLDDQFLEEVIENNNDNRQFYYMYYIAKEKGTLDNAIFSSFEYLDLYKESNINMRAKLLKLKADFKISKFKYKEAIEVYKRIEELKSI